MVNAEARSTKRQGVLGGVFRLARLPTMQQNPCQTVQGSRDESQFDIRRQRPGAKRRPKDAFTLSLTDADLSTTVDCAGGAPVGGGIGGLEAIFEGPVFNLLQAYIDDNLPPLDLPGLDFGGIIALENLRLLTHGNEFDTDFEDYFALTAEVVADP